MVEGKKADLHLTALRRLYCVPRRAINLPVMIKFAARRGVGEMMVAINLFKSDITVVNARGKMRIL